MRTCFRTTTTLGWLTAAVLLACDPTAGEGAGKDAAPDGKAKEAEADAKPKAEGAEAEAEAEAGADAEAAVEGQPAASGDACIQECLAEEKGSATNEATCRLLCGQGDADDGTPPELRAVLARHQLCVDGCDEQGGRGSDRATCRLLCSSSAVTSQPELAIEERACMSPCLDKGVSCTDACDAEARGTDRDTCHLQCDGQARSCLGGCRKGAAAP